ncbi:MAG: hypothetical protein CVU14_03915 [Bacteroidetes bacterium HGW-Bacteroidetes-9]|jgi:threonine/homoserine/homoserine lactone efflux protein|nr:MAG: hypothetical protein CVU14_03915 [Bacteroidetes bacterium HGW-Bacteroidetes-9]
MLFNSILFLLIGAVATFIGAVPFGLVNLSVADVAIKVNICKSMSVAFGAAIVEILFAVTALLAGSLINNLIEANSAIKYSVLAVLFFSGVFFWFKKNKTKITENKSSSKGFLKGVVLNLISIQVLLFWLVAIAFLSVKNLVPASALQMVLFVVGVWLAKVAVLWGYAILARKVAEKSASLSSNINRIIGALLVFVALIQLMKI